MSFGFGISDFEYVFSVIFRVRNFLRGIKDAPKDFDALRAEAECLEVCLNTISYEDCSRILLKVTSKQAKDLKTIIHGCRVNMEELIGFVAKCQRIAVDVDGRKPEDKSVSEWFREQNLWTKIVFFWKEKQPMREKLAIPIQSLNIYLVSLTYVSLSYNTRLSGGPGGQDYDFGSDSDSDGSYLSPHKSYSPPRHSARDTPYAHKERSPHQESSARYESFKEQRESRVFEPYEEKDKTDQAAMRRARRKGYDGARRQIKEERKKAIIEMTAGVEEIRALQVPSHPRSSSIASKPDVRTYIEVIYSVIIDRAPPEVERINAREFEVRSRNHEPIVDSDESFDVDSEPETIWESISEGETETNLFAIPEEEYTPCTKGFGGLQTFMADRDRELSLREREMSIRDREASLREREMALMERERTFQERQHSTGHRDMSFAPGDYTTVRKSQPGRPRPSHFQWDTSGETIRQLINRRPNSDIYPREMHT
jgi:hypothetical protein